MNNVLQIILDLNIIFDFIRQKVFSREREILKERECGGNQEREE